MKLQRLDGTDERWGDWCLRFEACTALLGFENFLTESLVNKLRAEGPIRGKVKETCELLAKLGVRNPSERSIQAITAVFLTIEKSSDTAAALDPSEKLSIVLEIKKNLKNGACSTAYRQAEE